jgi:chorismate mutase/prephenate dehydratase
VYTLAYLGPPGTFSQEAAFNFAKAWSIQCRQLACADFDEIFELVSEGAVDFGIVPIENSLEGSISVNLDLLVSADVQIHNELILGIDHCLLGYDHAVTVTEIISHPQALAQCRETVKRLYPGVTLKAASSTSQAAKEVALANTIGCAALGTRAAGQMYGLRVLKDNMSDNAENQTRFLVISRNDHAITGTDKTSIVVSPQANRPGALHSIIEPFARYGINLTKIESRPSKRFLGEYLFFIDFEGHRQNPLTERILNELTVKTSFLKMLGSYPRQPWRSTAKVVL